MGKFLWLILYLCVGSTITFSDHIPTNENSHEKAKNYTISMNIKRKGKFASRLPMKTSRIQINEQKHKLTTNLYRPSQNFLPRNPKPKLTNWYKKQSKPRYNRPKIEAKQFVAARPRPPFLPFRLTPASFLIPAIPTLVGRIQR